MLNNLVLTVFVLALRCAIVGQADDTTFHPASYQKSKARCSAVKRDTKEPVEIDISYVELNPSAPVALLMVHGWPGLWSSWSNQIMRFKNSYHLVVPDLRGFGESTHPNDVQSSGTMGDMVGDLVCVLDHAKVTGAVCVGHDWGSQICYEAARMRPDLFKGVVGAVIPYIPANGAFTPVENLVQYLPKLAYQVYFEKYTTEAIQELNKDIRRSLRSVYRSVSSPTPPSFLLSQSDFLGAYPEEIDATPLLSLEEEDYLVEQFSLQGFDNTLQFYTHQNRFLSHAFDETQGNFTIAQPVLAIYPTKDPVADWIVVEGLLGSKNFLPLYQKATMETHHWPQLEQPDEFNKVMLSWLEATFDLNRQKEEKLGRQIDEL